MKSKEILLHLTIDDIKDKSLPIFYDIIAEKLGYNPQDSKTNYDCRKILISEEIQNLIFDYYHKQQYSDEEIGVMWVYCGSKTNETLKNYDVKVFKDFIFYK